VTGCDGARDGNWGTVTNGTDPSTKAIAQVVWRTRTLWCDAASHELAANDYVHRRAVERPLLRLETERSGEGKPRFVLSHHVRSDPARPSLERQIGVRQNLFGDSNVHELEPHQRLARAASRASPSLVMSVRTGVDTEGRDG
jgi:hypothetical protein